MYNWFELHKYWKYSECSDPINGSYDPLGHTFLKEQNPWEVRTMEHDHDFGYVTMDNDKMVINFQGSDDFKDWIDNLRALRNDDRGDVHKGFYETAKKFRGDIDSLVKEYQDMMDTKNVNIVLCGGSRGGSIVLEISRYIAKHLKLPVEIFTYGAPRIGGEEWLAEFLALPITYHCVINGYDIVPNMPFKSIGFVDLPTQIYLPKKWRQLLPWMWKKTHLGYEKPLKKKMR